MDEYVSIIIQNYGAFTYILFFLVIFAETGLVVTPFLPGDSLLFAVGVLSAQGILNIFLAFFLILIAVFIGDNVNYWIGRYLGPKVFREESRFFKREYLDRTQNFYEKHGGKAVIIARFMPIIRTFAPFVAGIGKMKYLKFLLFSITGSLSWVTLFLFGGYFFGGIPFVKDNFEFIIIGIIIVSFIPIIVEIFRRKR